MKTRTLRYQQLAPGGPSQVHKSEFLAKKPPKNAPFPPKRCWCLVGMMLFRTTAGENEQKAWKAAEETFSRPCVRRLSTLLSHPTVLEPVPFSTSSVLVEMRQTWGVTCEEIAFLENCSRIMSRLQSCCRVFQSWQRVQCGEPSITSPLLLDTGEQGGQYRHWDEQREGAAPLAAVVFDGGVSHEGTVGRHVAVHGVVHCVIRGVWRLRQNLKNEVKSWVSHGKSKDFILIFFGPTNLKFTRHFLLGALCQIWKAKKESVC